MRTKVCFTIDIEFSIAGAFSDPARRPVAEPLVWCNVDGRSQGLGFLLDTFKQYDIGATFFVETVHRHHFRHDPMRPISRQIHDAGHEVQLHTHPCWSLFAHDDWWERSRGLRKRDDFHGLDVAQSVALIEQGIATFAEWGLPRPQVFRSGNLQHDDNLYLALQQTGIPYSSNVATAIFNSGLPDYTLYSGSHRRHGVLEFPVLTFCDWQLGRKQHTRSLTIAGTSLAETRRVLEQARAAGIEQVVILTHPFEYVHSQDSAYARTRRNQLTQARLTGVCQYLHEHNDRFDAVGVASAARHAPHADTPNTLLPGSLWHSVPRMAAQVAHEKYGRWMLARTHGKKA
ncbi:MAG: polysaccharide deacetylase family protein [Pseudomonadota bacterium]